MMANLPQPNKKINYPIAHDDDGGCLFVYKPTNSANSRSSNKAEEDNTGNQHPKQQQKVVLCCPGFPDDHKSFMALASRLAQERDCLVGIICLPGFDDRPQDDKPWTNHWKDGYTWEEMIAAFKQGAKALMTEATTCRGSSSSTTITTHTTTTKQRDEMDYTVVLHDWAVPIGMIQINRSVEEEKEDSTCKPTMSLVPNQVVIMDVGLPFHPKDAANKPQLRTLIWPSKEATMYEFTSELSYRFILAFMFFLRRYVSPILAIIMFVLGAAFLNTTRIGPSMEIDNKLIRDRKPDPLHLSYLSYVYYNLGVDLWTGGKNILLFQEEATLPILDDIDVLYMYGTEKRIMFHDKKMVDVLNDDTSQKGTGQSKAVCMNGGGHWFYLQQPERSFQEICKFLNMKAK